MTEVNRATAPPAPPQKERLLVDTLTLLGRDRKRRIVWNVGLLGVVGLTEFLGLGVIFAYIATLSQYTSSEVLGSTARTLAGPQAELLASLGIETAQEVAIWGAVGIMLVFAAKVGMTIYAEMSVIRFIFDAYRRTLNRLMEGYLKAPYEFHMRTNSSELLEVMNQEVPRAYNACIVPMSVLVINYVSAAFIVLFLLYVDWLITIMTALLIGGGSVLFYLATRPRIAKWGFRRQVASRSALRWLAMALAGIKEVRMLGREPFFAQRYGTDIAQVVRADAASRLYGMMPRMVNEGIFVSGIALVVMTFILIGETLNSMLPVLAVFGVAGTRIMGMFNGIVQTHQQVRYSAPGVYAATAELRKLDRLLADGERIAHAAQARAAAAPPQPEQGIRLENLTYTYQGAERPAVDGVSITIGQGQSIAFVGSSGAGKSTLVNLLLGLLTPQQGRVLHDGVDIHVDRGRWYRKLGYIPQAIFILDGSVRDNVAFGLDRDEIDDARVWQALEMAQLAEFVRAQPEGLDARVGENGVSLSGGQRQRVGIARALYPDPEILVMDEATAALDNLTELKFSRALLDLGQNKTLIYIAHRLTTIRHCDVVHYMEGGRIIASGTYEGLIESNRTFREMALASPREAEAEAA